MMRRVPQIQRAKQEAQEARREEAGRREILFSPQPLRKIIRKSRKMWKMSRERGIWNIGLLKSGEIIPTGPDASRPAQRTSTCGRP